MCMILETYRQVSNIRRTKSQHLKRFSYCLTAVFAESLEARCQVENEDVVGAAPTGDAPTISEWSPILLPTKVWLILETLQYCNSAVPPIGQLYRRLPCQPPGVTFYGCQSPGFRPSKYCSLFWSQTNKLPKNVVVIRTITLNTDGLVQDCGTSISNALELLKSWC